MLTTEVTGGLMLFDLLVDVTKLGIPVRVLLALDGLGVARQAEALRPQQVGHRVRRDPPTLGPRFGGQLARRPPQRRHRITVHVRLQQGQQRRPQACIELDHAFTAPARPARPTQRLPASFQIGHTTGHRTLRDPAARATSLIPP